MKPNLFIYLFNINERLIFGSGKSLISFCFDSFKVRFLNILSDRGDFLVVN